MHPLPKSLEPLLEEYLPQTGDGPFVTLTYAQSVDAKIAAEPGVQTKISHLETKTMTHFIRSQHDAILVGVGTVLADDPSLTCRLTPDLASSPRPVVVDPRGKWNYSQSKLRGLVDDKQGKAPYILVASDVTASDDVLEKQGGMYIASDLNWNHIFDRLYQLGLKSIMVEGGGFVIKNLLAHGPVHNLIVTIGPVFLGDRGVDVSPPAPLNLTNVKWWTGVQDSVLFAKVKYITL